MSKFINPLSESNNNLIRSKKKYGTTLNLGENESKTFNEYRNSHLSNNSQTKVIHSVKDLSKDEISTRNSIDRYSKENKKKSFTTLNTEPQSDSNSFSSKVTKKNENSMLSSKNHQLQDENSYLEKKNFLEKSGNKKEKWESCPNHANKKVKIAYLNCMFFFKLFN